MGPVDDGPCIWGAGSKKHFKIENLFFVCTHFLECVNALLDSVQLKSQQNWSHSKNSGLTRPDRNKIKLIIIIFLIWFFTYCKRTKLRRVGYQLKARPWGELDMVKSQLESSWAWKILKLTWLFDVDNLDFKLYIG